MRNKALSSSIVLVHHSVSAGMPTLATISHSAACVLSCRIVSVHACIHGMMVLLLLTADMHFSDLLIQLSSVIISA